MFSPSAPSVEQFEERAFIGYDGYSISRAIPDGVGAVADDCIIEGAVPGIGGSLVTRPSFRGVLTSLASAACYPLLSWARTDGSVAELVVKGGALFVHERPSGTFAAALGTAVTLPGTVASINGPTAFATKFNDYIYIIDGAAPLLRFSADATQPYTAAAVVSLTPPTPAPSAVLTNKNVDPLNGTVGYSGTETTMWGTDVISSHGGLPPWTNASANQFPNADFTSGAYAGGALSLYPVSYGPLEAGGVGPVGGFDFPIGNVDFHQSPGGSTRVTFPAGFASAVWCLLDDPGEGFKIHSTIANVTYTNQSSTYCTRIAFGVSYWTNDVSGNSGIDVVITPYNSTTALTAKRFSLRFPYNASPTGEETLWQIVDFADIYPPGSGTQIDGWRIEIYGSGTNVGASNVLIKNPQLLYLEGDWSVAAASGGAGLVLSHSEPVPGALGAVYYSRLIKDYTNASSNITGGSNPFVNVNTLVLQLGGSLISTLITAGLSFRVGFRANGGTTVYTNPATFDTSSGIPYAFLDISTISSTLRSAFRYLELLFDKDIPSLAAPTTFTVSGILTPGNLTIGGGTGAGTAITSSDYRYIVTTLTGTPFATSEIDSDASPSSVPLTPTSLTASANVILPAIPSADSGIVTYYQVWRQGGTFDDGYYRLIATLPVGSSITYGSDSASYGSYGNPTIGWTFGTKLLYENTPDSFLLSAPILLFGKSGPPNGAQCITVWGERLILGKGGRLFASWLLNSSSAAALYFTTANLSDNIDPAASEKGYFFDIGTSSASDPIKNFVPFSTELLILKSNSLHLVSGNSASNVSQVPINQTSHTGLLAPKAVAVYDGKTWFLGVDGVYSWDGGVVQPEPLARAILNDLNPKNSGATATAPAAYANAAFMVHDQRLLLIVPAAGAASNAVNTLILVMDHRTGGWTRWKSGPFAGFTQGVVFSSAADTSDLILGSTDGQLVYVNGYGGDKQLPSSSAANVTMQWTSKQYGQQSSGIGFFTFNVPQLLYWDVSAQETCTFTAVVTGDVSGSALTNTFTLQSGVSYEDPFDLNADAQGSGITVSLSIASKSKSTIRGYLLQTCQGYTRA